MAKAIESVHAQQHPANSLVVAFDHERQGSSLTRDRAMHQVTNEWVMFLDDDDELLPNHLSVLSNLAIQSGADVVWSWYRVIGGTDPIPYRRGKQWDPNEPHAFPIVALVRTELAQQCTFVRAAGDPKPGGGAMGDDKRFHVQLSKLGAKFRHTPEVTWLWHHDSGNTSGRPDRW